jgi:hypothetical protein
MTPDWGSIRFVKIGVSCLGGGAVAGGLAAGFLGLAGGGLGLAGGWVGSRLAEGRPGTAHHPGT